MRPIQPFNQQRGGQRRRTLSMLKQFVVKISGGDEEALLGALFQTRFGKQHSLAQIPVVKNIVEEAISQRLEKWKRVATNIKNLHHTAPNSKKRIWASLLAEEFNLREMRDLGFEISARGLATARTHAQKYGAGAPLPKNADGSEMIVDGADENEIEGGEGLDLDIDVESMDTTLLSSSSPTTTTTTTATAATTSVSSASSSSTSASSTSPTSSTSLTSSSPSTSLLDPIATSSSSLHLAPPDDDLSTHLTHPSSHPPHPHNHAHTPFPPPLPNEPTSLTIVADPSDPSSSLHLETTSDSSLHLSTTESHLVLGKITEHHSHGWTS